MLINYELIAQAIDKYILKWEKIDFLTTGHLYEAYKLPLFSIYNMSSLMQNTKNASKWH